MKLGVLVRSALVTAAVLVSALPADAAGASEEDIIRPAVASAVLPVMRAYDIPGVAVAVTVSGKRYVFNYGVASLAARKPVSDTTLFEVGSITKTFTATLATLAEAHHRLSLNDQVQPHLPSLAGSALGAVHIVHLATHSAGGFPLHLPAEVKSERDLMAYFRNWQPQYTAGTHRTYSNPSVGLLGLVAAQSMNQRFADAVRAQLFEPLGMSSTFLVVPPGRANDYAQGYTRQGEPVRMKADVLSDATYGVKTTVTDLIRFVEANLGNSNLDLALQQAIAKTHEGHLQVGRMTQDLIWEQYDCPAELDAVVEGSSPRTFDETLAVTAVVPPHAPRAEALLVKSGSTNGFGAYVALVPAAQVGVVIAANKNFPVEERIKITWRVLATLESLDGQRTARRQFLCIL